jgi:hypothetical protein
MAAAATINPIRCPRLIWTVVGMVVETFTAQLLSARRSLQVPTLAPHGLVRDRGHPERTP